MIFVDNIEELFDYLENLKLEEKLRFMIDKGNSLFMSSKTKTIKFLKNLVLDIIYFNNTKMKLEDQSTAISEKVVDIGYTRSKEKKRTGDSSIFNNIKDKNAKNNLIYNNNKISYSKLIGIFSGFPSQLEDFIEFVLTNEKECQVEFLYRYGALIIYFFYYTLLIL